MLFEMQRVFVPPGRFLILSDNLALVLALCKGRSNKFTLLSVLRRIFASSRRTGAAEPRHTEANAANSIPSGLETRSGDSRAEGGHLPHDACEARRTFDAGEQSSHGTS